MSVEWCSEHGRAAVADPEYCWQCLRDERDAWQVRAEKAEREHDLAIAHDRQPYPTARAYEKACEALNKAKAERDQARKERDALMDSRLEKQRDDLVAMLGEVDEYLREYWPQVANAVVIFRARALLARINGEGES